MNVCIYLRKSRADEEIERTLGQGETLRKHRKTLLKYAEDKVLNIIDIKEEIVSGDSLFNRPKMLELLKEVSEGKYDGVLVMDIDRLGRGGMKDQGIILETFKDSNTLIITPSKTYNLNDDTDEEMTEFKAFFARRELKVITKRMQGGRKRSVLDGNYIGTSAPYGYDIAYVKKARTLKINEEEAEVVRKIYEMYIAGDGASNIANYLNSIGKHTKTGRNFERSSVLAIIKNMVYIGKITWNKKKYTKSKIPGKRRESKSTDKSEWIISDGKHKPIISEETFYKADEILKGKYHIPYNLINPPVNPLAGVLKCGICKKGLVVRKYDGIMRILCPNSYSCNNMSSRFDIVEKKIIELLKSDLEKYKASITVKKDNSYSLAAEKIAALNKETKTLNIQKNNLYDLLERGIYSEELFLERQKNISDRIENIKKEISILNLKLPKKEISKEKIIEFSNLLNAYTEATDIKLKQELISKLVSKILYKRDRSNGEITLEVFYKLL